jgi:hypothetical protein
LARASLAFFRSTFAELDFEQPPDQPATIAATNPAVTTFAHNNLGLEFMKSRLWLFQGYLGQFTTGIPGIAGSRCIKVGKAATGDDLGSRTADRTVRLKRRQSHSSLFTTNSRRRCGHQPFHQSLSCRSTSNRNNFFRQTPSTIQVRIYGMNQNLTTVL